METASMVGLDLAKNSFQVHGMASDGSVAFRKKLTRDRTFNFLASLPATTVAMEACGGAHYWAREIKSMGHQVKLIPPIYVKPFVKRQKNDASDAEAIAEAASRPTMRFVAPKSVNQQALCMTFRTRDMLVRQRTQTINALRGHLSEFGIIAPQGPVYVARLESAVQEQQDTLPAPVVDLSRLLLEQIAGLDAKVRDLEKDLKRCAREEDVTARLMTIPGVGPMCASAVLAFAPAMEGFRCGRDFSAWIGLTPRQNSTGGKARLGRISKMGQRDLRRLLVSGAMCIVRWACRRGAPKGSWLESMLQRKPRMLVAVALANKMARTIWALIRRGDVYRVPGAAA